MKLADQIYCTFGGGGGDTASSTAPVGGHPEPDGTVGRNKMRKGGPDKGGVAAQRVSSDTAEFIQKTKPQLFSGGAGSGCKGPNCGRPPQGYSSLHADLKGKGFTHKKTIPTYMKPNSSTSYYHHANGGDVTVEHHPETGKVKAITLRSGKPGESAVSISGKDPQYGNLMTNFMKVGKSDGKTKTNLTKTAMRGTSGGQSEGSSKTALLYYVVDGAGRVLHTYRTREEAEHASAGNRYSKVVTHVEQKTPMSEIPEVRDMIRKRPGDNQVRVFRHSVPYPNPLPGGPQK